VIAAQKEIPREIHLSGISASLALRMDRSIRDVPCDRGTHSPSAGVRRDFLHYSSRERQQIVVNVDDAHR
jgi:hypothetical protein